MLLILILANSKRLQIVINMIKRLIIITLLLTISSCKIFVEPMPKSWNWGAKPRPLTGVRGFPESNTFYGRGFMDGCETAWAKVTRGLTESILKPTYNYQLRKQSNHYNLGWFDGFEQCTYIVDWDVV